MVARAALALTLLLGATACDQQPAPDWAWFEPTEWEGQRLEETSLAPWIVGGIDSMQLPARVILYRSGCEQCGQHFDALAKYHMPGALTLILIPEPEDSGPSVRERAPDHNHLELTRLPRGYGVPTPTVLLINEGQRITHVRTGDTRIQ
ncbi:MAG: hypothetical protein CMJ86_02080 [Planctomycetes bacterium]|nr:hypothetical protein [Planctomycetota bacterium]